MEHQEELAQFYQNSTHIPATGCLMWEGQIYIEPKLNGRSVRMMVWSVVNGDIPNDCRVVQSCGTRECIRVEHLVLESLPMKTIRTNIGVIRIPTTRFWKTKHVTDSDAKTIRQARMDGVQRRSLAKRYDVSESTIWFIENGQSHNKPEAKPEGWFPGCTIKSMKNKPQSSDPGAAAGG